MSSSSESIETHTKSDGSLRIGIPKSSAIQDQGKHAGDLENAAPQCIGGNSVVPLNKTFLLAGPLHAQSSSKGITVMHEDGIAGESHPFGQSQYHERGRPSDFGCSHEQPIANYLSSIYDNDSIPSKDVMTETESSANQTDSRAREGAKQMVHGGAPSLVTSQTIKVHGKASQSQARETRVGIGIALKKARFQFSSGKDIIPENSSFCSDENRAIHLKDEKVDNVDNPDDVYIDLKTGSKVKAALCPTYDDANLRKYEFVTNETGKSSYRKHEGCGKMEVMIGVVLALLVSMTFLIGTVVQLQMRISAMEKIMANIELNKIAENSGLQNFLSDNGELFLKTLFYFNINDDWDDGQKQKSNNEQKGHILSRHTRDVVPQKDGMTPENQTQKTSSRKKGTKNKEQNNAATLESSQFEFDFFDEWYDYRTNFTKQECFQDKRWPTQPFACRGSTIRYPQRDSPLAFYAPQDRKHTGPPHKTRKRKGNTPLLEISNRSEGYFSVRESGVYLIHLNIMIVDETQNHSLGIFLNNLTVLACPRGGFRCPHTNAEGSYKYRICNIDGILEMNVKDQLQIRTMEPNTTVRFDNKRKSQFRAVLLHKSTKANS